MKKSAFISDLLFAFGVVFLPALCLLRYRRLPLWAAFTLAAMLGVLAALAVFLYLHQKREKLCLEKQDRETKEKLLLHLALQSPDKILDGFADFFSSHDETGAPKDSPEGAAGDGPAGAPKNTARSAAAQKRKNAPCVRTEQGEFYPVFSLCPLDADRVVPLLCGKKQAEKYLLCNELTEEAEKLCLRFGVRVIKGNDVYRMLKKGNALPEHYLGEDALPKKKRKKELWFAKSNSRRFLFGGALILLTSLITPFPYYYLLSGSLLIISAVFVRIFGYR